MHLPLYESTDESLCRLLTTRLVYEVQLHGLVLFTAFPLL